jgi:hypothetical protein
VVDISSVSLRDVVLGLSVLASAWLVRAVWKSKDPLGLKIALTVVGFVPILGPILLLWNANFPDPLPMALRDQYRGSDVHDRWYHVLAEKNPFRRFKLWRQTMHGRVDKNDNLY